MRRPALSRTPPHNKGSVCCEKEAEQRLFPSAAVFLQELVHNAAQLTHPHDASG
jgi:hypothetical protein